MITRVRRHGRSMITHWVLPVGWLCAMLWLSLQPNLFGEFSDIWSFIIRKQAHLFEYGVLTYFLYRLLYYHFRRAPFEYSLAIAVALSVWCAGIDETLQLFVVGRNGTPRDVMIDAAGVAVAAWLVMLHGRYLRVNE